ncbi:MAG: DUF2115 domain-containing protein [ANME-2 cluster archaeon]|nr:DUF2115 domain-containing protein [ANME-2 cluster archaeon]
MAKRLFKKLDNFHELHESVHDSQTLLSKLKKELAGYTVFDLMKIQAQLEKESRYLPPGYKKLYKEKMGEQLFGNYKAIISGDAYHNQKLDGELYAEFLNTFQSKLDDRTDEHYPDMTILYHMCALYNIFVTLTPPHPEGTPFPGGFVVEKKGEDYYCPVREKQEDNNEALCKFCVAKQTDME